MTSPFQNACQLYSLEPWTDELIESYIEQHLQNAPIQFSTPDKRDIIKKSGGVPSKVRELCYECFERYRD
jgi:type II secretory pathway predicted ATPase ExeA